MMDGVEKHGGEQRDVSEGFGDAAGDGDGGCGGEAE
jgi:hypothetical protein